MYLATEPAPPSPRHQRAELQCFISKEQAEPTLPAPQDSLRSGRAGWPYVRLHKDHLSPPASPSMLLHLVKQVGPTLLSGYPQCRERGKKPHVVLQSSCTIMKADVLSPIDPRCNKLKSKGEQERETVSLKSLQHLPVWIMLWNQHRLYPQTAPKREAMSKHQIWKEGKRPSYLSLPVQKT